MASGIAINEARDGILPPKPQPRGAAAVVWMAAAAIVAVTVLTLILVLGSYRTEIRDTKRQLATLDALLAEETTRAFQNVALVLDGIVEGLKRDGVDSAEAYSRLRSSRATHEMLNARTSGVPQLDALTLIGTDGDLVNFSRNYPIPKVNVSDRDYYKALRDTAQDRPVLSAPVLNRGTGTWTIYLARRVNAPDGSFLGLVLGAIDLAYFNGLYGSLGLEKGMALSLWRDDGTLLARYPAIEGVGNKLNPGWLKDGPPGQVGIVYEVTNSIDGPSRIVASKSVKGFDAVVNATVTHERALADWKVMAFTASGTGLFACIAIIVVAYLLVNRFRTHEALAAAMADRDRVECLREQAEAQLRQSQKMEALGHLTGGVAHDFNNMLAIVVGSLDILKRRMARGERDLDRFVDSALDGAARAASLTRRLLSFSRQQPLRPTVVDADAFVEGLDEMFARTLGKSLDLRVEATAAGWRLEVDTSQLENALLNLALNARDAMPEGGRLTLMAGRATLEETGSSPAGDYVSFTVTDTGTGMAPETVARAFEPFFTTKEVGRGTGLGLSQVYGFVTQSGGRLDIRSVPGAGTSVRLHLPRSFATKEPGELDASVPLALHPGETVMIVDDEDAVRTVAADMLRDLGYSVVIAQGAHEALKAVEASSAPALLLTDIMMPGMDGRALAKEVRARHPRTRVLYMTGYAPEGISPRPGEGVLSKPFDMGSLSRSVRDALTGDVVPERLAG